MQGKGKPGDDGLTNIFSSIFALVVCLLCAAPTAGYEWTPLPDMKHVHKAGTMTVMRDGRVLLIGGAVRGCRSDPLPWRKCSTRLREPFESPVRCIKRRSGHCSVALADGSVLVAEGQRARPSRAEER
jgi:hypothetical protein